MVALRKPVPHRMRVDEFLAWVPEDPDIRGWELADGEALAMAPGSETHAALQAELARLLGNHFVDQRSPCRVLTEPGIVPRVRSDYNYRVPDLAVTCAPPSSGPIVPDPVLVIEILSPSNEARTRTNIWAYTTLPSILEILALHTSRMEAELLRRGPDGNWPEQAMVLSGPDELALRSIDFGAPLAALYRTTALAAR